MNIEHSMKIPNCDEAGTEAEACVRRLTSQNVPKPKRPKTKTSPGQNVPKPKRPLVLVKKSQAMANVHAVTINIGWRYHSDGYKSPYCKFTDSNITIN